MLTTLFQETLIIDSLNRARYTPWIVTELVLRVILFDGKNSSPRICDSVHGNFLFADKTVLHEQHTFCVLSKICSSTFELRT